MQEKRAFQGFFMIVCLIRAVKTCTWFLNNCLSRSAFANWDWHRKSFDSPIFVTSRSFGSPREHENRISRIFRRWLASRAKRKVITVRSCLSSSVVLEGQCCYPLSISRARARERDGGGGNGDDGGPGLLRKKGKWGARGCAAVHSALLPYTCNVVWGAAARAQGW